MTETFLTVIIGGGQAGLVAGYFLKQHEVPFIILDANEKGGGSWQHYYESLHLFSPVKYAELPGLTFLGERDHYPSRYEVIDYLRRYEQVHELPVRHGVRVTSVQREEQYFILQLEDGGSVHAATIISATGPFNTPHMPTIPGDVHFTGTMLHSFDYTTPEQYAGQHVVVVGSRDSAMQIAYDLSPFARVTMATRHPLKFLPKYFLGKSIFWWLHDTGYDELPLGLFTELDGSPKILGKEPYQTALAQGNPKTRTMFSHYTENGVMWANGETEEVNTVIYATGYRPGLGYLAPLGALDEEGKACHRAGVSTSVPGLFYVGLFGQRSHSSATLRGVDKDAAYITRKVAAYIKKQVPISHATPAPGD